MMARPTPKTIAMGAAIVVAGSLLGTLFPAVQRSNYDAATTMTAFTVIGLIWYTYIQHAGTQAQRVAVVAARDSLAYERERDRDALRRRRLAMAWALRAELGELAAVALAVRDHPAPPYEVSRFEHPSLTRAADHGDVFQPTTSVELGALLQAIAQLRASIGRFDAEAAIEAGRHGPDFIAAGGVVRRPLQEQVIQGRAREVARLIERLEYELINETQPAPELRLPIIGPLTGTDVGA